MRKATAAAVLFAALGLAGCTADDTTARLTVQPAAADSPYVATFERALFTETGDGQTDVVLLSGNPEPGDAAAGNAVRQVVHLRVRWEPTRTISVDSPAAGNAMVDWRVVAGDADRVTYAGSCWARVKVDGDDATVDVRDANVTVRQVVGQMTDPLKRARLDGKFVAHRADATVRAYVDELSSGDKTATASAALPPARTTTP